jgi:flavin reductase (DIM6/NTAB) family NADH-FMN oxidoreductase RutF
MDRKLIDPSRLVLNPVRIFMEDWFILCSGENLPGKFNFMTIGWGSVGVMWGKPCFMAPVRPVRHTYKFMEKSHDFTVCVFPKSQRKALALSGAKSGRDIDKVKETGLTPMGSLKVMSPSFAEAELIIECKKIYFGDVDPRNCISATIAENYPEKDYHRMYLGEIVAVHGTEKYCSEK